MSDAVARIIADEQLPADYPATVDRWWRPLAARIAGWHAEVGRPIVVGINGPQGSGKSTVGRMLGEALLPELGLAAVTLSLDDFYLTRAARQRLARDVHPLFATRGVPGTHDVALGQAVLDALLVGQPVRLPRFAKAEDDRAPEEGWPRFEGPADIVLFEGWCAGARPQPADALAPPVNALERDEDADGRWRHAVNAALASDYADWFARIDRMIALAVPGFEAVLANRERQEARLREATPAGSAVMRPAEVRRFVSHYERLTRHMLAGGVPRDATVTLDADLRVLAVD
ncbi:kinase [Sphingomonas baiyangensis]|uniref:Kinase n=1 Tax=Sphingomonas baiyangensis TaxID=2572576 RepID=A0A4U1L8V2_9SPHN|nr:kinase [Sphingomonas baiyangensis]TKD52800.1 kinase [Sphingomonas baiyangensis]